jgi:hypothetical protein
MMVHQTNNTAIMRGSQRPDSVRVSRELTSAIMNANAKALVSSEYVAR